MGFLNLFDICNLFIFGISICFLFLIILLIHKLKFIEINEYKTIIHLIIYLLSLICFFTIPTSIYIFYKSNLKVHISNTTTCEYNIYKLNDVNCYYKTDSINQNYEIKNQITVNADNSIINIDNKDLTIKHKADKNSLKSITTTRENWCGYKKIDTKYILYLKE